MKREVYEPQRIYPKYFNNPQPFAVTTQPEITFIFKEQLTTFTPYQVNKPNSVSLNKTFNERFSHDVLPNDKAHPNNAFVHLRNEISNLRSEFSKLIQKDQSKTIDKVDPQRNRRQVKDSSINKRENQIQPHSAIGFYNKASQVEKNEKDLEKKPRIEHSIRANESKSVLFDNDEAGSQSSLFKNQIKSKLMAKSCLKREETTLSSPQSPRMEQLQMQLTKIDQSRKKAEEEVIILKSQFKDKQKKYLECLEEMKNKNQYLERQLLRYEEEMKKQKEKHEGQISSIEQTHEINLKEILSNYERAEQELQTKKQEIVQIMIVSSEKEIQLAKLNEKNIQLESQIQNSEKQNQILAEKIEKMVRDKRPQIQLNDSQALKKLAEQNEELHKRLDSYKKSIQQLNISNNSSRQKLTKTLEEIKILREEKTVKQALINSLYRDIGILDIQMRQLAVLKSTNVTNQRLIDELTQTILQMQCQHLNNKYRQKESTFYPF